EDFKIEANVYPSRVAIAPTLKMETLRSYGRFAHSKNVTGVEFIIESARTETLTRVDTFNARVRVSFDPADTASEFEGLMRNDRAEIEIPGGEKIFALPSGPIVIKLYLERNLDDDNPDFTFYFESALMNESWQLANFIYRRLDAEYTAGRCTTDRDCFLTTAAVETIGLADDCWELKTLRKFRDTWLAQQPGGMQDIKRYYRHAPAIAEKLSLDPRRMTRLYFTGLLPSALTAKLGMNKTARWIYTWHMRRLIAAERSAQRRG
ncbi:MAG: CFI-box-CTERM domain-containing protein, partial [Pseudomonadota bacterium]